MIFNSLQFLFFFIIVSLAYYLLPHRFRWSLLLSASCYFYMVFMPVYILIIFFTIIIDYFAGIYIERTEGKKRKYLLVVSLISNIGILAVFKYYNFFIDNISELTSFLGSDIKLPYLSIILPIGLSFHTFQAMSYTIEVYRGKQKAERHFGIYALYVMFYPQLVAGPIERPQNVLHQFHEKKNFKVENLKAGLMLMAVGFFKKVVIADRLAVFVDHAYQDPSSTNGLSLLIASFLFAFQIYCDFSGYSDIALGTARIMGFDLMANFRTPYLSKTVGEFWSRWHISLSTWFKDYLYIPLGGNRVSVPRWYLNILIVFLVSGFWHGANWTFIVWGVLHGIFMISESMLKQAGLTLQTNEARLQAVIIPYFNGLLTFALVTFAWIFFRAENVQQAFIIIHKIGTDTSIFQNINSPFNSAELLFSFFLVMILIIAERYYSLSDLLKSKLFYPVLLFLVASCYFLGLYTSNQFIYFQF